MFAGYTQPRDSQRRPRWAVFTGASVLLYASGAAGLVWLIDRPALKPVPREIDVTLAAPPPELPPVAPPPAPTPPPPTVPRTKPPPAQPPPIAPSATPPPAAAPPTVAPTTIPDEAPPEATPTNAAPLPTGTGTDGASELPTPAAPATPAPAGPPPVPSRASDPIQLPEDAEPAEPSPDNVPPSYPEEARAKGLDSKVVLKFVVGEDGTVRDIQVLKGEEPFVASALEAVKRWKYRAARIDGQVVASFKVVTIPFRIRR